MKIRMARTSDGLMGATYFHGSAHEFEAGAVLTPESGDQDGEYVYLADSARVAALYAQLAASRMHGVPIPNDLGGVYEVEPLGSVEDDPVQEWGGEHRTSGNVRVLRKVDPASTHTAGPAGNMVPFERFPILTPQRFGPRDVKVLRMAEQDIKRLHPGQQNKVREVIEALKAGTARVEPKERHPLVGSYTVRVTNSLRLGLYLTEDQPGGDPAPDWIVYIVTDHRYDEAERRMQMNPGARTASLPMQRNAARDGIAYGFEERTVYGITTRSILATDGGEPVGYLTWGAVGGEIQFIEVEPEYRRQGIATELLRRAREIDSYVHHSPSEYQTPDGRSWSERVASLHTATDLMVNQDVYYRVHHLQRAFSLDDAQSVPLTISFDDDLDAPRAGYSACYTPWDLWAYVAVQGWVDRTLRDEILIFSGEEVGEGIDGEPLIEPDFRIEKWLSWRDFLWALSRMSGRIPKSFQGHLGSMPMFLVAQKALEQDPHDPVAQRIMLEMFPAEGREIAAPGYGMLPLAASLHTTTARVHVPDDPERYGDNSIRYELGGSGPVMDPRGLPSTVYHVTTAGSAIGSVLHADHGMGGGLGGNSGEDRSVSFTISRQVADDIASAMSMMATAARIFLKTGRGKAFYDALVDLSSGEGWAFDGDGRGWLDVYNSWDFGDWMAFWLQRRESVARKRNPLFFGVKVEHWARVNSGDVGYVTASRQAIIDSGAMVTDFDLGSGNYGLQEIRVWGDVRVGGFTRVGSLRTAGQGAHLLEQEWDVITAQPRAQVRDLQDLARRILSERGYGWASDEVEVHGDAGLMAGGQTGVNPLKRDHLIPEILLSPMALNTVGLLHEVAHVLSVGYPWTPGSDPTGGHDGSWRSIYASLLQEYGPGSAEPLRAALGSKKATGSDYRMTHQPTEGGPPLHDLLLGDMSPRDVYENPQYYTGFSRDAAGREVIDVIRQVRGNPDAMVTIYRSLPPNVPQQINPGDWISVSRSYAAQHGLDRGWEEWIEPAVSNVFEDGEGWVTHDDSWPVISRQVPAWQVRWPVDDLVEMGWFPNASRTASLTEVAYRVVTYAEEPWIQDDRTMVVAEVGGARVGHIIWDSRHGGPMIDDIEVIDAYRRQGIATEMLRRAREIEPDLAHSPSHLLTGDGAAWSQTVGSRERSARMVQTYPAAHGGKYHARRDPVAEVARCRSTILLDVSAMPTMADPTGKSHPIVCPRCMAAVAKDWQRTSSAPIGRPGEATIPSGTTRLYHVTHERNLDVIQQQGLLVDRSVANMGAGNATWASKELDYWGQGSPDAVMIEFYATPEQMESRLEWHAHAAHVGLTVDIPASQFVAVHERWHAMYWSLDHRRQQVLNGDFDHALSDDTARRAIEQIKREGKHVSSSVGWHPDGRERALGFDWDTEMFVSEAQAQTHHRWTMRYLTNALGMQAIETRRGTTPDSGSVDGFLTWKDGVIDFVRVENFRRSGLATFMLEFAREITPDLRHSPNLLPDGRSWMEAVGVKSPIRGNLSGYQFVYEDDWSPLVGVGFEGIAAVTREGYAGHLSWDYTADGDPYIAEVWIEEGHRRKGVATELLRLAREIEPTLAHSDDLSDMGRSWMQAVGANGLTFEHLRGVNTEDGELVPVDYPNTDALVAREGGKDAGFILWYAGGGLSGSVDMVWVDPAHRRKGLATELLRRAREVQSDIDPTRTPWFTDEGKDWVNSLPGVYVASTTTRLDKA